MNKKDSEFRNLQDLEEMEREKILAVRQLVEREDPAYKEEDDFLTIRRFLRARDLDVEKAASMFLKYLKWRRDFLPRGSVLPSEIQNELAQKKAFLQGYDKQGRPVVVFRGCKHFQTKGGEFKRLVIYILQKACEKMLLGQEKIVFIVDLKGWGYANSDIRANIDLLNILQNYYPERLGKVIMLHVPYIFLAVWKLTCPFIDPKTREKIVFVENKRVKSVLLEDIEESEMAEIYGGRLPLCPIEEASTECNRVNKFLEESKYSSINLNGENK